jgi:hypothetical protein
VCPDAVSLPDGISRSRHSFEGTGTLDAHFKF